MLHDTEKTAQRLASWIEDLARFDLPDWDALPQMDLYMDQVVILLTRYLAPMSGGEGAITASTVNNYVRMKIMPPPVKKKYSRVHIAYLIIICTLKQSLSISCIQRLLPEDRGEASVQALYREFVGQFRAAVAFIRRLPEVELPLRLDGGSLAMTSAILSTLSKVLTEFLLQEEGDPYEEEEDYDE